MVELLDRGVHQPLRESHVALLKAHRMVQHRLVCISPALHKPLYGLAGLLRINQSHQLVSNVRRELIGGRYSLFFSFLSCRGMPV